VPLGFLSISLRDQLCHLERRRRHCVWHRETVPLVALSDLYTTSTRIDAMIKTILPYISPKAAESAANECLRNLLKSNGFKLFRRRQIAHHWAFMIPGEDRLYGLGILIYQNSRPDPVLPLTNIAFPTFARDLPTARRTEIAPCGLEISFLPDETEAVLSWSVANLKSVMNIPNWIDGAHRHADLLGKPLARYLWTARASRLFDNWNLKSRPRHRSTAS